MTAALRLLAAGFLAGFAAVTLRHARHAAAERDALAGANAVLRKRNGTQVAALARMQQERMTAQAQAVVMAWDAWQGAVLGRDVRKSFSEN